MTSGRRLPLARFGPTPEQAKLLSKGGTAFFDDDELCLFCGHYGPNMTHSMVMGTLPDGRYDILSLHCTECMPTDDGSTCWQRPGQEGAY